MKKFLIAAAALMAGTAALAQTAPVASPAPPVPPAPMAHPMADKTMHLLPFAMQRGRSGGAVQARPVPTAHRDDGVDDTDSIYVSFPTR